MPFCDAYMADGALSPSAERELLGRITDLLLEHEGVDRVARRAADHPAPRRLVAAAPSFPDRLEHFPPMD